MKIFTPIGFTEKGIRGKNEDYIYPSTTDKSQDSSVFLVCDGVGGENKGELASQIVGDHLGAYFELENKGKAFFPDMQDQLSEILSFFKQHINNHPESRGMATTMTFLKLHETKVELAHIGDSRIYHVRHGKILWKSKDHSYVQELLSRGLITEAEAYDHPQKNVVTRAIQAGSSKEVQADVHSIEDLEVGDIFFLCTDGVWEAISEQNLLGILSSSDSNQEKIARIKSVCAKQSKDNYSAYLIQIESLSAIRVPERNRTEDEILEAEIVSPSTPLYLQEIKSAEPAVEKKQIWDILKENSKLIWYSIIGITIIVLLLLNLFREVPESNPHRKQEKLQEKSMEKGKPQNSSQELGEPIRKEVSDKILDSLNNKSAKEEK